MQLNSLAAEILLESINIIPTLWGAWLELAPLITNRYEILLRFIIVVLMDSSSVTGANYETTKYCVRPLNGTLYINIKLTILIIKIVDREYFLLFYVFNPW